MHAQTPAARLILQPPIAPLRRVSLVKAVILRKHRLERLTRIGARQTLRFASGATARRRARARTTPPAPPHTPAPRAPTPQSANGSWLMVLPNLFNRPTGEVAYPAIFVNTGNFLQRGDGLRVADCAQVPTRRLTNMSISIPPAPEGARAQQARPPAIAL